MITQQELKEQYVYNELTGLFIREKNAGHRWKKGMKAGCLCNKTGYIKLRINGKLYQAHRLAWLYMTGSFPTLQIDHKDQNRNNNIWSNLRTVTNETNSHNMSMKSNNTTGVSGVCYHKHSGLYIARIQVDGKSISLGYYKTIEEAKVARELAKKEYNYGPNHS